MEMRSSVSHEPTPPPDVAAILEGLRAEVRARRQAQGGAATERQSAVERQLQRCVEQLEITRVVSAHWPLEGRSLYARAWVLVHKLVRRFLRWYINPIVEQQNAFNDVSARTLRLLVEAHAELRDQLAELEQTPPARPPASGAALPAADPVQATGSTATLQALVEEQGRAEPSAALHDLALRTMPAQVAARAEVSAHWRLSGATPLVQARALGKRAIRQYLRWLINPIVEQQNAYNAALAEALPPLLAADVEARARLAALRAGKAEHGTVQTR